MWILSNRAWVLSNYAWVLSFRIRELSNHSSIFCKIYLFAISVSLTFLNSSEAKTRSLRSSLVEVRIETRLEWGA